MPWPEFYAVSKKLVEVHNHSAMEHSCLQGLPAGRKRQEQPVRWAYKHSDAAFTRRVLRQLEAKGLIGCIAAQLFRAQKASSRAKDYRGDYRGYAYERKAESLNLLCDLLSKQNDLSWGWGTDDQMDEFGPRYVLYIELPRDQVSFHSYERFSGLDYPQKWDGEHTSAERIVAFCEAVLTGTSLEQLSREQGRARFAKRLQQQRDCSRAVPRHDSKSNWYKHCKRVFERRAGQLTEQQKRRFAELAKQIEPGNYQKLKCVIAECRRAWRLNMDMMFRCR